MPIVDLVFTLRGDTIAHDHGYQLYSALCHEVPSLHKSEVPLAVLPIRGFSVGDRKVALTPSSRLILRLPSDDVWRFVGLAGKTLQIGSQKIQIGVPSVAGLSAAPRLYSRLVTVKGHTDPASLLQYVIQELKRLGVCGTPSLPQRTRDRSVEGRSNLRQDGNLFIRRTFRVRERQIVGYAVQIDGLESNASVLLQEVGLGGRRRMGAGIFLPTSTLKPSEAK